MYRLYYNLLEWLRNKLNHAVPWERKSRLHWQVLDMLAHEQARIWFTYLYVPRPLTKEQVELFFEDQ